MILRDKFLLLNCQNCVLERQHSVTLCSTTSDHFLGLDGCGSEDILSKIKIKKKLPSDWSPGSKAGLEGWLVSLELEFRVEVVGREHVNDHAGRPHRTACWAEA